MKYQIRKQLIPLCKDAFDDQINSLLNCYDYHNVFPGLIEELKWKPNEQIQGRIFWGIYDELGGDKFY